MFRSSFQPVLSRILAVASLTLLSATVAWSGSYKVIHAFARGAQTPSSGLVVDKSGNGYGTTAEGGFHAGTGGTVYQLSPTTGFNVIYGFSGPDGLQPQGNLVFDTDGNLYGTTVAGESSKACQNGCGTVFKLTPPANAGSWTETVLYSFTGGDDGKNPQAGVILDSAGNLYGTTRNGGTFDAGVVFQLSPAANTWTENVLHAFTGGGVDGGLLQGGLIFDTAGNLYGTSGAVVFEMTPSNGGWSFNPIYFFDPRNGDAAGAEAGVIFDAQGNLYGTSSFGGAFNRGTVFQLIPDAGGWTESVIYSFAGGNDGANPEAGLALDGAGNLYGTTFAGGGIGQAGTVFQLTPGLNGQWTERLFHFPSNGSLGSQSTSPLLLDGTGHAYGTTSTGGRDNGGIASGVVFRIAP